jgi:hypothetical protein
MRLITVKSLYKLILSFMILANAFAWPPDNYDMYFVNEWLESINVDSNSLILSFSRSELVWNKKKEKVFKYWQKVSLYKS